VAGELAIARGAAAIAAGRLDAALAGGVDELDPFVATSLAALGVTEDGRGEGAAFLVLESGRAAAARGASILGEILGAAWRALPAPPHGVGRRSTSRAVAAALADAGVDAADLGWVYPSASGDAARDAWEGAIIDTALAPHRPPATSLHRLVAHHAGLGALRVAAAAWTARAGLLPLGGERPSASGGAPAPAYGLMRVTSRVGLVHGVARGGTHVALVVGPPPEATP
jgi:3-oxoacyl-[acyl-carrier-protein] synthase II